MVTALPASVLRDQVPEPAAAAERAIPAFCRDRAWAGQKDRTYGKSGPR